MEQLVQGLLKLLVIGRGGREHALAWKLAQSPRVGVVYVADGNAGTADEPKVQNVPFTSIDALVQFALHEEIHITIVGPEGPLAAGAVDAFHVAGLKIFGPTQKAAQLESSKDFAKEFMKRHRIPTAPHKTFSDPAAAHAYVEKHGVPIVIKADGLAAGKGVEVATNLDQAHAAVDAILVQKKFKGACDKVVIEDYVDGEEASFIVMADGKHALALASSQDHKRVYDGDKGPNCGGAGAISPSHLITPDIHARIMKQVVMPTITGMAKEGMPFVGFLYVGLMIKPDGTFSVLEYNVRSGDPETQPIMIRLQSDLVVLLEHALDGTLDHVKAEWDPRSAVGIMLMAEGYPENPRTGDTITGVPANDENMYVFHSGTVMSENGDLVTAGGRVMCLTVLDHDVEAAQCRANKVADIIQFAGKHRRTDIGGRAVLAQQMARC